MNLSKKPINQHSLQSLELWLTDLGAVKDINNPSKWYMLLSDWNATIIFEQEDLEKVFEPFYTTKKSGTGLGLAVVYGIVEAHGGTIKMSSQKGVGTEFRITLKVDEE